MIAHLEVTIDYPEEDIEDVTSQEVRDQLEPILKAMDELCCPQRIRAVSFAMVLRRLL